MKTLCNVKREWTETTPEGITLYHSPELDQIQRQWGDIIYRQREKEEAGAREAMVWTGDYIGYGNGLSRYAPEFVSH